MRDFIYSRATDVADAAKRLAGDSEAKLLAGGMTLLPTLKNRLAAPSALIDLGKIAALRGIAREDDSLVIRAMTTHAEVAASEVVRQAIPALANLAGMIGDPAVRHCGTIGGSIANADPAADYPAAVVGLNAMVQTSRRKIAADDFFTGMFETTLEPDEIVTAVHFALPDRAHYMKFRHPASGYAVVGVMIAQFGKDVRVAVTGAAASVFRVPAMEAALAKSFTPQAIADITVPADDMQGDIHCSAEYRAHLVTVYARRAVEALVAKGV
jgi:carbon-monoxide dehydrogenase medium subunit